QGERIYQSMLDSEHAGKIAESNQLGLSNLIYEHLLRTTGAR
ncbi:rod-binding protein, partial [bacterium]|nr:rod-binding protein [bacterium]